jgi:hypothetical protein
VQQGQILSIKLGMEKATQYLVTQIEFAQPVEDIQSIQK